MRKFEYLLADNNGGYVITLEVKMYIGAKFEHDGSIYLIIDFDNEEEIFLCQRQ